MATLVPVPSGREFDEDDLGLMRGFAEHGVVERREKPLTMKGGRESYTYVQGRNDLTENPRLLMAVARKICRVTKEIMKDDPRRPCFIGIPTAGSSLAIAAGIVDEYHKITGRNAASLIMREQKKIGHGASDGWVVGKPDHRRFFYIRVDNTITDGGTKIEMNQRFKEDGFDVADMFDLILIDRQQGGMERIREQGFKAHAIYELLDVISAMYQIGQWPEMQMKAARDEILALSARL